MQSVTDLGLSVVRHGLTLGAGVLVTRGVLDAAGAEIFIGSLMGLAGLAASYLNGRLKRRAAAV